MVDGSMNKNNLLPFLCKKLLILMADLTTDAIAAVTVLKQGWSIQRGVKGVFFFFDKGGERS